jgi:hypothetical protein
MQDPKGVMNMRDGDLAPKCPACPAPERNLPANWRDAAPENRFVVSICDGALSDGSLGGYTKRCILWTLVSSYQ